MSSPPLAILWDIDGTLLRAQGAGVTAFVAAFINVTGLPFPKGDLDMGGRTDPAIARRMLQAAQAEGDHDELADSILVELARQYAANEAEFAEKTLVYAGVVAALQAFCGLRAVQTVVTGNIEPVARMKVSAAGVAAMLALELGGYGSDHMLRAELVHTSRRRIAVAHTATDPDRTWIIGDTPRDFECARAAGVRCILVATGMNTVEILEGLGADAVFADLTDLDRLLATVS